MIEIPSPYQSLAVIGHDAAKAQFQDAFAKGRLHHAWLLTGPSGIGKATLAIHMAHMILSNGENRFDRFNPQHTAARLLMAEAHPDFLAIRRAVDEKTGRLKDTIPVDEARKLAPFLSLTASQNAGRVALIDEAHLLNRNGQNAILKMIEEPPTGAVILLTATTVGALLPTIRSRCRVLPLAPLSEAQIGIVFARLGVELPADQQQLCTLSGGSVGQALRLLQSEVLPLYAEVRTMLQSMPHIDLVAIHKLADRLGRKDEGDAYGALTQLIVQALRESVRCAALGAPDSLGIGTKMAASGRLDQALEIWDSVRNHFEAADRANLDKKLALINAFSCISREMS